MSVDWIGFGYAAVVALGGAAGYIRKGKHWYCRIHTHKMESSFPLLLGSHSSGVVRIMWNTETRLKSKKPVGFQPDQNKILNLVWSDYLIDWLIFNLGTVVERSGGKSEHAIYILNKCILSLPKSDRHISKRHCRSISVSFSVFCIFPFFL